ncbi:MAG: type 1 glutamine amidotransferase [Chromatiaceae bacterium]
MNEIQGRKVAVLAEDLYEDLELWYPTIRLREAGAVVVLLGTGDARYTGKHGLPVEVDGPVESARVSDLDALVIPGGYAPDRLRRSQAVLELVRTMDRAGKLIAFICHAGWVPASAGILKGRRITSFSSIRDDMENAGARWEDNPVVTDGNLVTSRSPEDLPDFCDAIIGYLAG